jgi:hypothetical protein
VKKSEAFCLTPYHFAPPLLFPSPHRAEEKGDLSEALLAASLL